MLRTLHPARSLPSLRTAFNVSAGQQQRGLASRVLLNQVPIERLKVTQLKSHLRQRQLSTTGPKAALITRLKQAGIDSVAPEDVPPMPTSPVKAAVRHASSQPPKAADVSEETISAPAGATISSTKVVEASLPAAEDVISDTDAPGLPENPFDNAGGKSSSLDTFRLPARVPETEDATPIPTILSYKGSTFPPAEESDSASKPDQAFTPKIATAASNSTEAGSSVSSPSSVSVESSPEDTASSDKGKDSESEKSEHRDLTDAERRGAWTLLGLIAGAYLVGGIGKEKPKGSKSAKELVEAAKSKGKDVKNKAQDLVEDVKGKGKDVLGKGKKTAEDATDAVKEKAQEAKGTVQDKAEEVKAKGKEVVEKGKKKAEEAKEAVKEKTK